MKKEFKYKLYYFWSDLRMYKVPHTLKHKIVTVSQSKYLSGSDIARHDPHSTVPKAVLYMKRLLYAKTQSKYCVNVLTGVHIQRLNILCQLVVLQMKT